MLPSYCRGVYNAEVLIAPGKVVGGRIEVDADLPEGAFVAVLVTDSGTFEADPETEKMLLEAVAQCRRGETTPLTQLLDEVPNKQ